MKALKAVGRNPNPTHRGQALVEFALVIGLFMLVIGGLVQLGIIFWSQNAITQVARETARYAATVPDVPCDPTARPKVRVAADNLARRAHLLGYSSAAWVSAAPIASLGAQGVGVDWIVPQGYFSTDCPPSDNGIAVHVRVRVNHAVPILLPGLRFFAPPCAASGWCISTETELRMEPKTP